MGSCHQSPLVSNPDIRKDVVNPHLSKFAEKCRYPGTRTQHRNNIPGDGQRSKTEAELLQVPEVEQDGVEADLDHRAGLRLPRLGAGRHGREDKVAGEAKAAQSRAAKVGGKGAQEGITGRRQGTFGGTSGGGGCCDGGRGE
jgi:hypothetical protein